MGKTSTRKIVAKVASALGPEPKNITEISKETDVDRKSVIRYLEALTNHNYVHEADSHGRTREFYIESSTKSTDPVEDIPEWRHLERVQKSKIKMMKKKASS